MDFNEAKNLTVKEIISKTEKHDIWAETSFMKLIDAKVGDEVGVKLMVVSQAMGELKANLHIVTDKLIESNRALAKSNEKYSVALCWLTGGLVFVGLVQATLLGIQIFKQ